MALSTIELSNNIIITTIIMSEIYRMIVAN